MNNMITPSIDQFMMDILFAPQQRQKFEVQIETGEVVIAELLTCLELMGKECAVYAIKNKEGNFDILASYVEQDAYGYDTLKDIDDPAYKKAVRDFLLSLTGKGKTMEDYCQEAGVPVPDEIPNYGMSSVETAKEEKTKPEDTNTYKFCRNCGNKLPSDANFCDKCGADVRY